MKHIASILYKVETSISKKHDNIEEELFIDNSRKIITEMADEFHGVKNIFIESIDTDLMCVARFTKFMLLRDEDFNSYIEVKVYIENDDIKLSEADIKGIITKTPGVLDKISDGVNSLIEKLNNTAKTSSALYYPLDCDSVYKNTTWFIDMFDANSFRKTFIKHDVVSYTHITDINYYPEGW